MRHGPFRAYFTTGLLSMMADNVEHVISYWVIFQAFHSPTLAGFAVISHWTPFLVLGVWFGGLADRYDCRKIIIASQVAFIAVSLAWALLFLTGTLQTWHAVVLLIVHGLAGALWSPAGQLLERWNRGAGYKELPERVTPKDKSKSKSKRTSKAKPKRKTTAKAKGQEEDDVRSEDNEAHTSLS
jgi:hypothetical protein